MPKAKVLRGQTRKTIYQVVKFMKNESENGVKNIKAVQKRAAEATGVSRGTVQKIIQEAEKDSLLAVFRTPGKKRRGVKRVTGIDEFDKGVIKRCIHNFHIINNELPTLNGILNKLRNDINFNGSVISLRRIIKDLGFSWKQTETHRKILIEHHDIRLKRIEYLEKITKYREEGRPIVYTDESYMDWVTVGVKKPINKEQRIIIAYAGYDDGFVPNCLHMFKSGIKAGDYHDVINFVNYEKWVKEKLIPNLKPNSVVVIHNAPYNKKQLEPTSNSRKADMMAWLTNKGISFDSNLLKPKLYNLIALHKTRLKIFSIDTLLHSHGHTVLRLPPCHPDLNPIELASVAVKDYVANKIVQWNVNKVMDLVKEKIDATKGQEWNDMCQKVIKIENEYKESDQVIDSLTEQFIINVDDNSDSGSAEENSDVSDSESNSSNNSDLWMETSTFTTLKTATVKDDARDNVINTEDHAYDYGTDVLENPNTDAGRKKMRRKLQNNVVTIVKTASKQYENKTMRDAIPSTSSNTKLIKTPMSQSLLYSTLIKGTKHKDITIKEEPEDMSVEKESTFNESTQATIKTFPKPITVPIELVESFNCMKQEVLDPGECSDRVTEYEQYNESNNSCDPLGTDIKIEIYDNDVISESNRR